MNARPLVAVVATNLLDVLVIGGGNSMHTRNLRCMHDAPQDGLTDAYSEEEFWQDLL